MSGSAGSVRHVAIATGTRADWGLLSPVARGLAQRNDVRVSIIATNMHLDSRFGNTITEIENDGFNVTEKVAIIDSSAEDSPLERAKATGRATIGFAEALARLKPDMMVILGDRFEMLGAATAAQMMRVPIVHISGGEITRGAIDDSLRHAITKLAALHLTATETGIVDLLMRHPGRVFPAEEIYRRVWGEEAWSSENTVMVHIRRIREKIELNPREPDYLKVVWGIGYKMEKK